MKIIQINPYDKEIKIVELKDIDDSFSIDLEKEAKEVEEGIKIVAYPLAGEENKGFFFYIRQEKENIGKIFTFNGIGTVFCNKIDDKVLDEISKKIAWQ